MRQVRLTDQEIKIIQAAFTHHFLSNDAIWLFGSRADLMRKGGDMDFYIETHYQTLEAAEKAKQDFWCDLQAKLGEQKMDIVMNCLTVKTPPLPIYKIAKATGVQLSVKNSDIKLEELKSQMEICEVHVSRIQMAFTHIQRLLPLQAKTVQSLTDEELSFLDLLINRFAKLQDVISQKIFPFVLELFLKENIENKSFTDRLNLLEKLEVLESVEYWEKLRAVRNTVTHEYPNQPMWMADQLNRIIPYALDLIDYWAQLKSFIEKKIF